MEQKIDEKIEVKSKENTEEENVEETKKEEEKNNKEEIKKEEESVKKEELPAEEPVEDTQVQQTEETGNGVRVEDLVTKEELTERLSSLEAKFDAVLKENSDLKNKLSEMEEKYENKDFGNVQRKGIMEREKNELSSFEEYSKQFMS